MTSQFRTSRSPMLTHNYRTTVSNLTLVIFLSLKHTPLAFLTAYSYERLQPLHQIAGYSTVACVCVHAIVYTVAVSVPVTIILHKCADFSPVVSFRQSTRTSCSRPDHGNGGRHLAGHNLGYHSGSKDPLRALSRSTLRLRRPDCHRVCYAPPHNYWCPKEFIRSGVHRRLMGS